MRVGATTVCEGETGKGSPLNPVAGHQMPLMQKYQPIEMRGRLGLKETEIKKARREIVYGPVHKKKVIMSGYSRASFFWTDWI